MPVEPPQNGEYLVAAYVIASIILAGYWGMLWRKARKLLRNTSSPVRRRAE